MASASEIFRTPPGPYARIEARRYYKSVGAVAILSIVVLFMLSATDFRFAIVALMVVCVVLPMLLLLAWLRLTASKEMQLHLRPQRWTRMPDGSLKVEFFPFAVPEEADYKPMAEVTISEDNIAGVEPIGKYHAIFLTKPLPGTYRFFIIPTSVIQENPSLLLNL